MEIGSAFDSTLTTILVIIHLVVCAWVYIDAQDRDQVGVLWALISFVLPIIGLAIYLLIFHTGQGKAHKAINRNEEFQLRSSTRQSLLPESKAPQPRQQARQPENESMPDNEFSDEELDRLISESRFRSAREYLKGMIEMAREMRDSQMLANYELYNARIYRAETGYAPGKSSSSRYGIG
jgi:hypothetical protein